jgi:hypothetical protein
MTISILKRKQKKYLVSSGMNGVKRCGATPVDILTFIEKNKESGFLVNEGYKGLLKNWQ